MSEFGNEACSIDPHCGMKMCCPCPACNDQAECLDTKCRKLKNYWAKQLASNSKNEIKEGRINE